MKYKQIGLAGVVGGLGRKRLVTGVTQQFYPQGIVYIMPQHNTLLYSLSSGPFEITLQKKHYLNMSNFDIRPILLHGRKLEIHKIRILTELFMIRISHMQSAVRIQEFHMMTCQFVYNVFSKRSTEYNEMRIVSLLTHEVNVLGYNVVCSLYSPGKPV